MSIITISLLYFIVHLWLHHTAHCTWWLTVAARLGCEGTVAEIGWANSRSVCIDRLRKHYSHLLGVHLSQER